MMQTINDYDKDVFNGDLGFVQAVDPEAQELMLNFDGRLINYDFGEPDEIIPAYAVTIHKSQGSEYPAVVIPLSTQHYLMLRRNLIYTGVTRGKQLVVLVGQRKALAIAVKNSQAQRRWSKLNQWLCGEPAVTALAFRAGIERLNDLCVQRCCDKNRQSGERERLAMQVSLRQVES